jgi:hypothetical protein
MGKVVPLIFFVCDLTYYEAFGEALELSAKAHGHNVLAHCTGERVDSPQSRDRHCMLRWQLLPNVIRQYGHVLMLDADSVMRRQVEIDDSIDIGFFPKPKSMDLKRKINGGCLYFTRNSLPVAEELKERISENGKWFDDQIALYRVLTEGKRRMKYIFFDDSFFSWKLNPDAPIWTGKGSVKMSEEFKGAVRKWVKVDWQQG